MKNNFTRKIILITVMILAFGGLLAFFNRSGNGLGKDPIPKLTWQANTHVYDKAKMLSESTKNSLNQSLGELDNRKTTQFIVLTVDSLGGQSIETYANTVFSKTGIGDKASDNGLLMLIAKDEKKVWVEVGQGLEGDLNDGKVGRILDDNFVPYRSKGDYDTAVLKTTAALTGVLTGTTPATDTADKSANTDSDTSESDERDTGSPIGGLILLGLIIAVVVGLIATGHGDILLWILMLFFNNRGGGSGGGYGGGSGGFGGGSSGGGGGFGGGSSSGGGAGR
ncbi:TPM domain-containing protein [Lactococcus paracarnosus]|uniref:TPM domain-containing protein n=1 Tax=Pseudolactococcus paracarnosus TaxID=2749962 RepID=A0ABT0AIR8_9LACT|nr:TPM domain-containing protein [Lactococcus paracarnosus]MCJ1976442.1 TPM domain-containing protein [Lactococcus paracarnosus]MCJ1983028.1 TPM domain-containing protein [Lactococcus paracarnosus]MCJ1997531.1 TPM domain-containing protein [Lactococcus paracarnosus]